MIGAIGRLVFAVVVIAMVLAVVLAGAVSAGLIRA
jgi:hypothetical protein